MTDPDGGVYLFVKSQGDSGHARVHLPDGSNIPFDYEQGGWTRYKMSFDFTAYDGAGAVTVFVKPGCEGEWIQMAGCTNVCMNLTPGSGDKNDYHVWDGVSRVLPRKIVNKLLIFWEKTFKVLISTRKKAKENKLSGKST